MLSHNTDTDGFWSKLRLLWGALAGLLLLLVFLLVQAPAALLPRLLQNQLPQLVLAPPAGTLWQGRTRQAWVRFGTETMALGPLRWELDPWSLLSLSPAVYIQVQPTPRHSLHADLRLDRQGRLEVRNLSGELPLAMLKPWLVPPSGMDLLMDGNLGFAIDSLLANERGLADISGTMQLTEARWIGGGYQLELGDYEAELGMDGELVRVRLKDRDAALGVDGYLSLARDTGYEFNARVQARESLPPEVMQLLSLFGQRLSDNEVQVINQGRFGP